MTLAYVEERKAQQKNIKIELLNALFVAGDTQISPTRKSQNITKIALRYGFLRNGALRL